MPRRLLSIASVVIAIGLVPVAGPATAALADDSADLSLAVSDGLASVTAGTSTTYTVSLGNDGPSAVDPGVVLTSQIPADTTGSESETDCDLSGGVFSCTTSAPIAPGDQITYQLALTVSPSYGPATLDLTAAVSSSPVPDPNPANDQAGDSDTVEGPDGPIRLPASGAWFGAYVASDGHTGPDRRTSQTNFEAMAGRPMVTDRRYYFWDDQFPTADDDWSRDQGHTLILSWNAQRKNGTWARWADIAAGLYDAEIDARAQAIKDFDSPVFLAFHHEPKTGLGSTVGTPADYIAAWQHIHDRFEADGVTNVTWSLILMAETYQQGKAGLFYPGDAYVDLVAADGFNWYNCNAHAGPWLSVQQIFTPFHNFALAVGKPMMIAEWGSGEDPAIPGRKGQWMLDGLTTFRSWPEVKVVSYYNSAPTGGCARWIDTSMSSLQAFQAIGADPYFNPPPPSSFQLDVESGPPLQTEDTSATFAFSATDPAVTLTCFLDDLPATPCQDGTQLYAGLPLGSHAFWVLGVDELGRAGYATWNWTVIPGADVSVADFAFNPKSVTADQGTAVRWHFDGPSQHTVTDSSGMGLFDSGPSDPGATFTFVFGGAGTYTYTSSTHTSMTGNVKVPVLALPGSGGASTVFTVTWAAGAAPSGYVYDVQIRRPGSTAWKNLKWSQIVRSASFVPDSGAGTYSFRARLRRPTVAKFSGWSPVASITVS